MAIQTRKAPKLVDPLDERRQPREAPVVERKADAIKVKFVVIADLFLRGSNELDLAERHHVGKLVVEHIELGGTKLGSWLEAHHHRADVAHLPVGFDDLRVDPQIGMKHSVEAIDVFDDLLGRVHDPHELNVSG